MKFHKTSLGCKVDFFDGEEFAGRSLFLKGETFSKGFLLDIEGMTWYPPYDKIQIDTEQKSYIAEMLAREAERQEIVVRYYE